MEVIYERCAGLDVHKKTVVACRVDSKGQGRKAQETRTFGTTTAKLLELLDWLAEWQCSHVAMESTGEYWKPVYNILEGQVEILLVNARDIKAVPGRKTDVNDAEWIAELLRHGLLRASFVPPRPQRELRDLTRQRSNLVRERSAVINRLQKVLEGANIKLASVTKATGVSVREIVEAMVQGESDPAVLAEMAHGRLRSKRAELEEALTGQMGEHHRFLLNSHLRHIDFLNEQIERFSEEIAARMSQLELVSERPAEPSSASCTPSGGSPSKQSDGGGRQPLKLSANQALVLMDTVPGIDRWQAEVILAETGLDMSRFGSDARLAARSGVAPGNNESAGKRRSGRTRPGSPVLKRTLTLVAHAAAHTKNTYLSAQYHRLAARRGAKRAIIAVAHSIIVIIYHILTTGEPYRELGGNYFDERKRDSVINRLVHRLDNLGYEVSLSPKTAGASAAA
jgi:transposase